MSFQSHLSLNCRRSRLSKKTGSDKKLKKVGHYIWITKSMLHTGQRSGKRRSVWYKVAGYTDTSQSMIDTATSEKYFQGKEACDSHSKGVAVLCHGWHRLKVIRCRCGAGVLSAVCMSWMG